MAESILENKTIFLVDDEGDILTVLEEEIKRACPTCTIEKTTNYENAVSLINSKFYDLVILDIMGVRGFDLLEIAVMRKLKVVMFTAHALSPEALKRSHELGALGYIPKDKLGEIVPFLEDALKYDRRTGWKRVLEKLENYFDANFDPKWKKKVGLPWY
ncbi:MAG TPA: response regulator [Syntrophorhabdaceae bacterium]|nr:response regulator [Syntrophorhabdaceae bacterium]